MFMRIFGTRRLLSSVRSGSPLPQLPTTSFYSFLRAHGEFAKHADLPAITCASSGRTLTYGELDRRVGSASRALARTGFAKGSVLSVHLPNCEQLVVAFFAATELGGVVTASNPAYTVAELAAQQSGARASAVISSSSLRDVVIAAAAESGVGVSNVSFIEDDACFATALDEEGAAGAPTIDSATDPCAMPFSSGTTGQPKGVVLSHRNLIANVLQSIIDPDHRHDVDEGDRLIGVLPLFHIYGMCVLGVSLARRAHLVLLPRFEPRSFLETMERYRINGAFLVPPILLFLSKDPMAAEHDLSALEWIVTGAASLDPVMQTSLAAKLGVPIRQGWGMTELCQAAFSPLTSPIVPGAVGRALPGTTLKVVDVESGNTLAPMQTGEICVQGPQVMLGYLDRPEETASILRDGWLHTGDLGHLDAEGHLFITERRKELIKVKGFQVARLAAHPTRAAAAAHRRRRTPTRPPWP